MEALAYLFVISHIIFGLFNMYFHVKLYLRNNLIDEQKRELHNAYQIIKSYQETLKSLRKPADV